MDEYYLVILYQGVGLDKAHRMPSQGCLPLELILLSADSWIRQFPKDIVMLVEKEAANG